MAIQSPILLAECRIPRLNRLPLISPFNLSGVVAREATGSATAQIRFGELAPSNRFYELATIRIVSAGVAASGMLLRQVLIVTLTAADIPAGPAGLGIIQVDEEVELLARMGIPLTA